MGARPQRTGTLRTPEGDAPHEALDMVFFPKGPEDAHEIRNDGESPCGC